MITSIIGGIAGYLAGSIIGLSVLYITNAGVPKPVSTITSFIIGALLLFFAQSLWVGDMHGLAVFVATTGICSFLVASYLIFRIFALFEGY